MFITVTHCTRTRNVHV